MKALSFLLGVFVFISTAFPAIVSFEEWQGVDPDLLPYGYYRTVSDVNSRVYGIDSFVHAGVTWDQTIYVVGNQFVSNSQDASDWFNTDGVEPFARPHSGSFAVLNSGGINDAGFSTTQVLTGVWFGRPCMGDCPGGAMEVKVNALAGSNVVASVSLKLKTRTPVFMDTSSFLWLSGITRYTIERTEGTAGIDHEPGFFVADDFQFASRGLRGICPCDGKRSDFIRCLRSALAELRAEGALTAAQKRHLLREARKLRCEPEAPAH